MFRKRSAPQQIVSSRERLGDRNGNLGFDRMVPGVASSSDEDELGRVKDLVTTAPGNLYARLAFSRCSSHSFITETERAQGEIY